MIKLEIEFDDSSNFSYRDELKLTLTVRGEDIKRISVNKIINIIQKEVLSEGDEVLPSRDS